MLSGPQSADRRAQHAWCSYLDALYHRATQDGTPWIELARCNTATSTAAPEMLEKTAACSQLALDGFEGDPFTDAYAAEVKRCGSATLEAMALPADEVGSYVSVGWSVVAPPACGHTDPKDGDCRADLSAKLGKRLGLAVGALSPESRHRVPALPANGRVSDDGRAGSRACLEPMLDRLLVDARPEADASATPCADGST